ncbi:MAG: glutathione S-transferase family protein [Rhodobacteraceae bacterium]|nr:glutathione S-transferase family protein [Paracoccaceae bacterium]
MPKLELIIGNKNYSSWSFRPWLAMQHAGLSFTTTVIPLDFDAGNTAIKAVSPHGKVPFLKHGDIQVWESLAILDYVAELYPDVGLWPAELSLKAHARSASCEMLSGFQALRGACPMNMSRDPFELAIDEATKKDVDRIVRLWTQALDLSGGDFLYGDFSIADAMFAPVVSRFHTYGLTKDPVALAYMEKIRGLEAWQAWERDARAESWVIAASDI